jgi:hypothetical protein
MATQKKETEKSITVIYTGEIKSVFAPGLGTFEKGESRTFTDDVSIDLAEKLIKGNGQFKEGEK